LKAMDDASRPWRLQVVGPLRVLRRLLAFGPTPAPSEASERLRARIKAAELDAEHLENDLLAACLKLTTPGKVRLARSEMCDVIRAVLLIASSDEGGMSSAIDVISEAADRLAR
jgi:hypothetical protein